MKKPFERAILQLEKEFIKIESNFGNIVYPEIREDMPDSVRDSLYYSGLTDKGGKVKTDKARASSAYALRTQNIKRRKGQKINVVTLQDSGDFYRSINLRKRKKSVFLIADFYKDGDHLARNFKNTFPNQKAFEVAAISPSREYMQKLLIEKIKPTLIRRLKM